jgi:hypothetical protein
VVCFNCNEEGHTLYRCTKNSQLKCCLRTANLERHGNSSVPVHAAECCPCRRDRIKFAVFISTKPVGRPANLNCCSHSSPSLPISVQSKRTYLAAAKQHLPAAHLPTLPKYPKSDPSKAEFRPIATVTQQRTPAKIPIRSTPPSYPVLPKTTLFSFSKSHPKRSELEVTLSGDNIQPLYSVGAVIIIPTGKQWYINSAPFYDSPINLKCFTILLIFLSNVAYT